MVPTVERGCKLEAIKSRSAVKYSRDDPYYKVVWKYLGQKIKFVKFDNELYAVKEVNTIEGVITADDGTLLYLNQLSTGVGQRNYLMAKLQTDDDRPIIALFDEVATMTPTMQKDIFNEFIGLQKKGKLLVGMMVLPTDDKGVEEFGL